MKRVFILTACLVACFMSWAAPVSKSQALQTASAFMKQKGWTVAQQPRLAPRSSVAQISQTDYIYVFNSTDGFVVISGDDQTEPVLAYAEGAQFDESQIPENMKWWLSEYERQIRYIQEHNIQQMQYVLDKPAISPMLTTEWSQDDPYNTLCPKVGNSKTPTGCLATAFAQVMNYHKWPQDATTSIPSYTTYTNKINMPQLPAITFDWSNMRTTYGYNASQVQKTAVANLMLYCGQATEMDYDPTGSGASEMALPNAFVNYFGYDESVQNIYRDMYTTQDWEEMVYNELSNNRPVLYCGQSTGGGHAFVCDGYDGNGLFHINWGWGYNDYFHPYCRLSILNPYTTSQTGASTTEDGFTFGQSITIGVRRPGVGSNIMPLTVQYDMDYTSIRSNTLYLAVASMLAKTYKFDIAMAKVDDNGNYSIVSITTQNLQPAYQTMQMDYSTHTLTASAIGGNGTYTLVPLCRKNGTTEWTPMASPELCYFVASVSGNSVSISKYDHTDSQIAVEDMNFTSELKKGSTNELVVDVKNSGTAEFNTELYCFQSTTSSKGKAVSVAGAYVQPGETEQVYFYFKPTASSDLTVWICTDDNGRNVIGKKTFSATPRDEYSLELTGSDVTFDPLDIKISVKNSSTFDYDRAFRLTLYRADTDVALMRKYSRTQTIAAGETGVLDFNTVTVDQSHDYYAKLSYYEDSKTTEYTEFDVRIPILFSQAAGIYQPTTIDLQPTTMYNLSGQRVSDGYKGIVIKKGKKVKR